MIKVVAKQFVKDGKLEEFLPAAQLLVEETNKNDKGCISYELFQDLKDPKILTIIEEWEDQDSLDKHCASKHFKELAPQFGVLCEKGADVNFYKMV
jgi:quinol monooxygenase YgiN